MADTDILTQQEAADALREDGVDDLDQLAQYVTAVSGLIDQRCGPVVQRTITAEEHYRSGMTTVVLRHRPVSAVVSVTEYDQTTETALAAMTVTSWPADGYRLDGYDPHVGLYDGILHRSASGRPAVFRGPVQVTYTAGRYASTTSVDARFKRAAAITLENLWRDRQQGVSTFAEYDVPTQAFPGFAFPRAAAELLAEELGQNEPFGIA